MRIPRFYCPNLERGNKTVELPEAAHRHAVQVLRLRSGDKLRLFDGRGYQCEAVLNDVQKRYSTVETGLPIDEQSESPIAITLLQGVSRGERMDYAIQKAVELGVKRIIPVLTSRCNVQLSGERATKKMAHWQGVMISACEQSGRSWLPDLEQPVSLNSSLDKQTGLRLVLDPTAEHGFSSLHTPDEVTLLIGPEGGLTDEEVNLAVTTGYTAVRFGPRILRTETASAAALAVIQTLWGDLG